MCSPIAQFTKRHHYVDGVLIFASEIQLRKMQPIPLVIHAGENDKGIIVSDILTTGHVDGTIKKTVYPTVTLRGQ